MPLQRGGERGGSEQQLEPGALPPPPTVSPVHVTAAL